MLAQLGAAKDPENALHTFHEPFTSLGSSQFGIVPNQTISVAEPKTPSASAPQGDWGTASLSGSPNRRAGYARGTAAGIRARKIKELKAAQPFASPVGAGTRRGSPMGSPTQGDTAPQATGAEDLDDSNFTALSWNAEKLDVMYAMVKQHERTLYEQNLAVQTMGNHVAMLLGDAPPNQQALRRRRYALSELSSPLNLHEQYDALDLDDGVADKEEHFPYFD